MTSSGRLVAACVLAGGMACATVALHASPAASQVGFDDGIELLGQTFAVGGGDTARFELVVVADVPEIGPTTTPEQAEWFADSFAKMVANIEQAVVGKSHTVRLAVFPHAGARPLAGAFSERPAPGSSNPGPAAHSGRPGCFTICCGSESPRCWHGVYKPAALQNRA